MCGIAGILHFDKDRSVDETLLRRMTDALSHRGPDGEGYYIENNLGLGHKRLAIIDLNSGAQPMISSDNKYVVVFNGEIYNYIELRDELKSRGHSFDTTSDTEVILKAYEEWGFECQNKFNGMWAFALWDARKRQLFLSRDRIGEKPLHYSLQDNSFLFGSEIKSILSTGFTYEAANQLRHIYLSLGYVPAPHTFFNGIYKIVPGHFLVVKDGKVSDKVYWDLPAIAEKDMRSDSERIYSEFEEYFSDSVKIRMRSDVPYGAFLSGGLDSACVVAAMATKSSTPVETFTIGFTEKSFDERVLAKEVAELYHTNHHEKLAEPDTFDESLNKVIFHFDEPFGDASAILVGLVSRMARQKVTMVLTGDGGDEVLSGYTSYVTEKISEQYRQIPSAIRSGLSHVAYLASLLARDDLRYSLNRARRFMYLSDASFEERHISKLAMLDRNTIRRLIPADVPQISMEDYISEVYNHCNFTDPFYRLMHFNLKVSLPDDMLAKVDRMSMAHSLETRVPFLDHRIIELTYQIHKDVKLPKYNRKNLLKRTYGKKLPSSMLKAPKRSFSVPLREWFKKKTFEDRLSELGTTDFGLNREVIAEIVNATRSSEQDYGDFIWRLFVLKKWSDK